MKFESLFYCSVVALLLASCGKDEVAVETENAAQGSTLVVPANDGVDRPMLDDAQKHLRFGGDYYAYTYVGDSYAEIADLVDEFVVVPFLKEPMAEEGVDVTSRQLLDWSGLSGVTAMGSSSHSVGEVFEIRQVVMVEDPSKGIWKLLGEARPSLSANVFGSDVSMAMDIQMDLRAMSAWLEELKPMLGAEFSTMLDQGMSQGAGKKTVGEILDGLNARLAMGVVLHSDKTVTIPLGEEENLELPDVDVIICAEGFTENFDELRTIISSQEVFEKVELPNGLTGYALNAEEMPPLPLENIRPVIAYDEANNRIFVCSRLSYLEETLSSAEKLKDNADYRQAMEGLPKEVISTVYFSKQVGGEIDRLLQRMGENNEQSLEGVIAMALAETEEELPGFTSDKALEMMNKLGAWKTRYLGNAWLSVSSRDGNAIYSVTRVPINGRPLMIGSGGSVAGLVALSSTSALFTGAKAWKDGSDRASCILNIRNMQQAVRAWQGMNNENYGDPINISDIVGAGKFIEEMPVCPLGGTYTISETIPEDGTAVMSCSEHDHQPDSTEGW